jgi:hypothetical protein
LTQAERVAAEEDRHLTAAVEDELGLLLVGERREDVLELVHHSAQIEWLMLELDLVTLELGKLENVVDNACRAALGVRIESHAPTHGKSSTCGRNSEGAVPSGASPEVSEDRA